MEPPFKGGDRNKLNEGAHFSDVQTAKLLKNEIDVVSFYTVKANRIVYIDCTAELNKRHRTSSLFQNKFFPIDLNEDSSFSSPIKSPIDSSGHRVILDNRHHYQCLYTTFLCLCSSTNHCCKCQ